MAVIIKKGDFLKRRISSFITQLMLILMGLSNDIHQPVINKIGSAALLLGRQQIGISQFL